MPQSILIVDDEAGIRDSLSSILTEEGYAVESVSSGEECLARLAKDRIDLVLLDIWLPQMDGIETLERMRRDGHFPMVVMISGHGNIETAVRATKLGAFDFVEKPLSLEKTMQSVKRALEFLRLELENRRLREELGQRYQVVGDMSLRTQAKVLRALEEQRLERVGSNHPTAVNVRVIAATNKKLEDQIARGLFREDLFYRLNVIPFTVPALRERIEDIPILTRHFLAEFAAAYGRKPKEISDAALAVLARYSWPGTAPNLRILIERLMLICPHSRIEPLNLPRSSFADSPPSPRGP